MSKRGLPTGVQMRHDPHYVEELATASRSLGRTLPIDSIDPNPEQPRVEIGDLTELSASIREKGVLEPLLVRRDDSDQRWMIIAGERRWRASRLAGLAEVPCIELDVDDHGVAEIALIENLQRKDLTVWEEADGLAALQAKFGYTHDEIARKISKSRSTVTELMSVAGLPGDIRERCRAANITSKTTLLEIARQFDDQGMHELLNRLTGVKKREVVSSANEKPNGLPPIDTLISENGKAPHTFRYRPTNSDFTVEVKFDNGPDHTKIRVLEALKQTFDEIKNVSG